MPYEKTCCQKINETVRQHVCLLILILDTLCLVAASVRTHSFRDFMSCEASDPKLESWLSPTSPPKKKIANLFWLVKSARRRAGRIPPYPRTLLSPQIRPPKLLTIWHCGFWHRVQAHHVEVLVYPKRIYLPINPDQFGSILGSPILRNNQIHKDVQSCTVAHAFDHPFRVRVLLLGST